MWIEAKEEVPVKDGKYKVKYHSDVDDRICYTEKQFYKKGSWKIRDNPMNDGICIRTHKVIKRWIITHWEKK